MTFYLFMSEISYISDWFADQFLAGVEVMAIIAGWPESYTENSQQEGATEYSKIQKKEEKCRYVPSLRYTKQTKGHIGNTGFDHRPTGWEANGALWDKKALQGRKRARVGT